MSLLDDATIIYVPGVYKASNAALQKPIAAGAVEALTFARSGGGATRVNAAGLIESVAANVPRVDFLNSTCGSHLLEPARTNLLTYSEEFDNASWAKVSGGTGGAPVVTANAGVAPDGTTTADRIVFDLNGGSSASNFSLLSQSVSTSTIDYSHSIYIRSDTGGERIGIRGVATAAYTAVDVTTEWQRVDVTELSPGGSRALVIGLRGGQVSGQSDSATVYIWGAQLEAGSYATSYVPTVASTVTRSAETLSKTGLASLLGDSEGTIYLDFTTPKETGALALSNGTGSNRIYLNFNVSTNTINTRVVVSGSNEAAIDIGFTPSTSIKLAYKYANNNFALWIDGVKVGTDLVGSTFADGVLTRLGFDSGAGFTTFYGNVKALAVFDTALTDTQLAELTT